MGRLSSVKRGYDIVTIAPTVSSGGHVTGDVVFNLTEVKLPSSACALTSVFLHAAGLGNNQKLSFSLEAQKMGLLFFKKNTQPTLGTLNATADISASDFVSNEFIGHTCIIANPGFPVKTTLSDVGFMFPSSNNTGFGVDRGEQGSVFEKLVVKGSGDNIVYVAGVIHKGYQFYPLDFGATDNVKIHFHFEY